MKNRFIIAWIFMGISFPVLGQDHFMHDSLQLKGQLSAYSNLNGTNTFPVWLGARYIPQVNYNIDFNNGKLMDFEASANVYANVGIKKFDSTSTNGDLKPYRLWARYSSAQFEVRVGLQKINFGSAQILRPLMWFDQVDPRDPLKLTDGVYGILARYYFLNNANIWLWGLYGNKYPKGWEIMKSNPEIPEFGGRLQAPVPRGEAGFSFHHRKATSQDFEGIVPTYENIPENRLGFDIRLDVVLGIWLEGSWVKKQKDVGLFTNQEIVNVGMDYTLGIGNGVYMVYEQLLASSDKKPFEFSNTISFSLMSLSYPIGLFDNLNGIVYYDWGNNKAYSFLNWQRQYDKITFHLMGYWNPKKYKIPTQGEGEVLFAGSGVQVLVVWSY